MLPAEVMGTLVISAGTNNLHSGRSLRRRSRSRISLAGPKRLGRGGSRLGRGRERLW